MGCTYRSVHYIDDTGEEKVSPLYCLKATQDGLDSMTLKNEAVKALTNSVIQKLLYFGYGGPGIWGPDMTLLQSHRLVKMAEPLCIYSYCAVKGIF